MKIKITPQQLAKQIPELRHAISLALPSDEYIRLDVEDDENTSEFLGKYPGMVRMFSPKELKVLSRLYRSPLPVARRDLENVCSEGTPHSNTIDVHIKNIRRKISYHKLPFEVETVTGQGRLLVEKDLVLS